MNIGQEQYIFSEPIKPFDPTFNFVAEYNPPPEANPNANANANANQTAIGAPLHEIPSNYNDESTQNPEIFFISSSDVPNNCIAYSNVALVPTIMSDGNQLDQIADAIELVKRETQATTDANTLKYILSSDQRFVNAFQTNGVDNVTSANLCSDSQSHAYIDQSGHMIATVGQINQDNLNVTHENTPIHHNLENVNPIEQNQIAIQIHGNNGQEVLLQDQATGQLYRHVQSIYENGPSELVPISGTTIHSDAVYGSGDGFDRIHNEYTQKDPDSHELSYQLPVSFVDGTSIANDDLSAMSKSTVTNLEMQAVEFIFNSYKNAKAMEDSLRSNLNSNQYACETVPHILDSDKSNYHQSRSEEHSEKDQQRILDCCESTMSTLCKFSFFE